MIRLMYTVWGSHSGAAETFKSSGMWHSVNRRREGSYGLTFSIT